MNSALRRAARAVDRYRSALAGSPPPGGDQRESPDLVDADPLAMFSTEQTMALPVERSAFEAHNLSAFNGPEISAPAPSIQSRWYVAGVVLLTLSVAGVMRWRGGPSVPPHGTLSVTTVPDGASVTVDGESRGTAPAILSLAPGRHEVVLRSGDEERTVAVTIAAGGQATEHFEFAPRAAAKATGSLWITADPAAGKISLDGKPRGSTPLVLDDLTPGPHRVSFASERGTIERKVIVVAGSIASVAFSVAPGAVSSTGWLTVAAPFEAEVFEGNERIGTSGVKVMLPAGRHDVKLVNDALGYTDARQIDVKPGKVASVTIDAPRTTLSANATPWAEVFIDGSSVGQTPLANVSVSIGTHEVVFRHPRLGEQRRTIVVTKSGPNRLSADMTHQ